MAGLPPLARRRVLVAFAAFGLFWGTWGAVLPGVRAQTGSGDGALGLALLMVGLGALVSMRATGWCIDRRGGVVLPLTVGAFAVTAVLPALARSPLQLGAALVLLGAASGGMDVAINAAGAHEEARTGPLMNLAHAGFSGAVLVASLVTAAGRALGAGPPLVLGTVGAVLVAVALWLRASTGSSDLKRAATAPAGRAGGRRLRLPPAALLVLGLLGALAYLVENVWQSWSAVHLETTLDAPPGVASLAPAAFAVATTTGRLLGQRLAGTAVSSVQLLGGGAAIAAVGTAVAATAGTVTAVLLGLVVAGLGTSVCAPTILSATGRWAGPDRRASAISTVTTLSYLGFLVGPAAVGVLSAAADLRTALAVVAGLALLLALLARTLPGPSRVTLESPVVPPPG